MAKILPWRHKAEFCVINDEILAIDESKFIRDFYNKNMKIYYIHSEGVYRIYDEKYEDLPFVELFVFQKDKSVNMYLFKLICPLKNTFQLVF